jgi:hypothetical protein
MPESEQSRILDIIQTYNTNISLLLGLFRRNDREDERVEFVPVRSERMDRSEEPMITINYELSPANHPNTNTGHNPITNNTTNHTSNHIVSNTTVYAFTNTTDELTLCPITLQPIHSGDIVCKLNACSHVFKYEPIMRWLGTHRTCPVCRQDVFPSTSTVTMNPTMTRNPAIHTTPVTTYGRDDMLDRLIRSILPNGADDSFLFSRR